MYGKPHSVFMVIVGITMMFVGITSYVVITQQAIQSIGGTIISMSGVSLAFLGSLMIVIGGRNDR